MLSMDCAWQRRAAGTLWPTKSKIVTIRLLTDKVCGVSGTICKEGPNSYVSVSESTLDQAVLLQTETLRLAEAVAMAAC